MRTKEQILTEWDSLCQAVGERLFHSKYLNAEIEIYQERQLKNRRELSQLHETMAALREESSA